MNLYFAALLEVAKGFTLILVYNQCLTDIKSGLEAMVDRANQPPLVPWCSPFNSNPIVIGVNVRGRL